MELAGLARIEARVVRTVDSRCELGESPLWLAAERLGERGLRWVDATRGDLHAFGPSGHERHHLSAGVLSAIAADRDGGLLLVEDRRVRADFGVIAEIPDEPAGVRFNDAKVGPDGRLWAGTVCPGEAAGGALWSIDPAGTAIPHWTGVGHGNGIAWTPAGDAHYFVDSGAGTLSYAPFSGDGRLGAPEVIARIDRSEGIPDGLAVDAAGDLWLAVWGGGCLVCLRPDGTVRGRVDLPAQNVTSCAFMGNDLELLAVTTAIDDGGAAPDDQGGSMFVLDVDRRGVTIPAFGHGW